MSRIRLGLTLMVLGAAGATPGRAQIARQVAGVENGTVRLSFAARPGVCGSGMHGSDNPEDSEEWESDCESQPVRVALRVRDHRVMGVRTYVGGRWRRSVPARDLGTVRPQEAAAYFLHLAAQPEEISGNPLLPATLADSVTIWPSLLELARSTRLPQERRSQAIFWLGQAAGHAVVGALDSIAGDNDTERDVRKQAVFALSQRSSDQSVPALIRIARTSRDPELRKTALFWLGQSEDPRALDLFEEILR
jgi:hypothetical protein